MVLRPKKKAKKKITRQAMLNEVDRNARRHGMERIGSNRWILKKK